MELINVYGVLKGRNPKLARRIPKFIIRYLERIIRQREINEILTRYDGQHGIEFIRSFFDYMHITYSSTGLEQLDPNGRYVFASNHPFGGMDGLMLADEVASHFGNVKVVVNDLLMYVDPLRELWVPVNKHGRQGSDNVQAFNDAFSSNVPIITFPAGLCSRRTKGVVADLEWRSNFIKKAAQSGRDIVPVYFDGRLSNFFYRLSNFRKWIGVKANIEMLYLPNEMFKQTGSNFQIHFGKPISTAELLDGHAPREAKELVRAEVYSMKK